MRLVVLSHLSWNPRLFQRPQQLALRFARLGDRVRYLSVEGFRTYIETDLRDRVHLPHERLAARMLPQFPGSWRFRAARALTDGLLATQARTAFAAAPDAGPRVLWLQHPRFLPAAERVAHDLLVYDCMDPHGAFANRDPLAAEFEERLLRRPGLLLFAGGESLAASLRGRGAEPRCLPSGIDFDHFAAAAGPGPVPEELAALPAPRLGYFGALDERIDWALLDAVAEARPHWSIVLLGPLLGLDRVPARARNIHHPGAVPYARLPEHLRAFDVALIPWKVDALTRFMSPTKTPEYLAGGRPVVSTPIPDVAALGDEAVFLADGPEAFLDACTKALLRKPGPPRRPASVRTWDETAAEMRAEINARTHEGDPSP
ncbi:MAG: glycosyltransferase [Candidatus Sumerlaeia bacterium]|nr:glycosyltransferase [Candidatus Sumerlaeia bacterium]